MCAFFSTLIIWELHFKVQTSFEAQNFVPLLSLSLHSCSPTFKLLSMASYGDELLLTHLLLEVASPIIFLSSPFWCHWSSRSKGLHWWRRSKAYKLHMGNVVSLHNDICDVAKNYFNASGLWNNLAAYFCCCYTHTYIYACMIIVHTYLFIMH